MVRPQLPFKKTMLGLLIAAGIGHASAQAETHMLRQPAVSGDHLAFVYGGDLWLTDRNGQHPVRLTNHPAAEFAPFFSPDGRWLAFSASYDGNTDVYVMPATGGQARRLTWHPGADVVVGWSPDSKRVLFSSAREIANSRSTQLYEVALEGGTESKVMEAIAFEGSWSADGQWLAYRPFPQAYAGTSGWRQHRGGTTPPVWLIDLKHQKLEKIPHLNASDKAPAWLGQDVVFISDRNDGAANLFLYHRADASLKQLTHETEWDVRSFSVDGQRIVYEAGGVLKELDTASGHLRSLPVDLSAQTAQSEQSRPQWKEVAGNMTSASLSPTGKRVAVTARGDVFTVPVKDGSIRNLTETSGVREKDALWSPDGKHIAYISDAGIRHTLILRDQTGAGEAKSFPLGSGYYSLIDWSPDSRMVILKDNHLNLLALNLKDGKITPVATSDRRGRTGTSFSSDSRWLAYTTVGANHYSQIYLYDFQSGKSTALTDGMSDADNPVFAKKDYLYFTASTNSGPSHVGLDMSTQERPRRQSIYAVVLAADGKSPLLPLPGDEGSADGKDKKADKESDPKSPEAKAKDGATGTDSDADKKEDKAPKAAKPVRIDLNGLSQRIVALPVGEKNIDQLTVAADGSLFYVEMPQPGASVELPAERNGNTANLMRFSFEDKKSKLIKAGIANVNISADGKKLLLEYSGGKLDIADASDKPDPKPVSLTGLRMRVDPRAEWEQIFNETWWMEKEFFYDSKLHGLDWDKVYRRYHPLLADVQRREDLNELLVEMIAELQVGHNRVGGGDVHQENKVPVGLLGADFALDNGHLRIRHILRGDSWNPFLKAPLAVPGLDVKEGDYLLAVNGKRLDAGTNLYSLLENTVGKQVRLTISRDLSKPATHDVTVEPIGNEADLRQWQWIEKNRDYVNRKTDGKVAYVYLPNTGSEGYQYFNRMFYPQATRDALIVDERRNGGGQAANYITDILGRPYLGSWKDRDGLVFNTPGAAIYGPKAMLIDQDAGSGGDFLPYAFKRLKLGDLIGKRTWGGLIGIAANPALIDGGSLVVPYFRFFTPDGEWRIENEGVSPDVDVELDPLEVNRGNDPQLDAAIQNVMSKLKTYRNIKQKMAPPAPQQLGR